MFYIMWSGVILQLIKGEDVELGKQLSVVGIAKLLFLNAPTYGYHLWYLAALCYVLVIEAALDTTRSEKLKRAAELCSIALLAIGIIIPIVCKALDLPYRIEIVRNFLFEGYPIFHIGRVISTKCSDDTKSKNNGVEVKNRSSFTIFVIITLFLMVGLLLERSIYDSLGIQAPLTIFTIGLAVVLVLWAIFLNSDYNAVHYQKYFNENREKFKLMEFKLGGGKKALVSI